MSSVVHISPLALVSGQLASAGGGGEGQEQIPFHLSLPGVTGKSYPRR